MKRYIMTFLIIFCALFLQGQNMLRYNFDSTLTETNGVGPALTVLGNQGVFMTDTLNEINYKTKTVYRFEKNSGFQLDNAAAGNFIGDTYTIELYFMFDELSSWKRVVDWKNRKTDNGAYVYYGQLNFYNYIYSEEAPVVAGEYTYYVITRNGATKQLRIYTDALVEVDFTDSYDEGIIDSDHVLNFFYDDLQVPDEASSGTCALLNLYNYVLDSATIKQNWVNINSKVFGLREQGSAQASLRICPNPAADQAALDLSPFRNDGPVRVSVTAMTGKEVLAYGSRGGSKCTVDVKSLPAGIYMVRAESAKRSLAGKLVIAR